MKDGRGFWGLGCRLTPKGRAPKWKGKKRLVFAPEYDDFVMEKRRAFDVERST